MSPLRTKQGLVVHLKCEYNQDTINFQTYCMVGHVVASLALSSHLRNIYICVCVCMQLDSHLICVNTNDFIYLESNVKHNMLLNVSDKFEPLDPLLIQN